MIGEWSRRGGNACRSIFSGFPIAAAVAGGAFEGLKRCSAAAEFFVFLIA
jgi:hypothetical protein